MKIVYGLLAMVVGTWLLTLWQAPPAVADIWWWRSQLINLSGALSFVLMGFIMLLAVRPAWLESRFGGLDRMYRVHKWAGIAAISFALLHYGLDLAKGLLRLFVERPPRVPRPDYWLDVLRGPVKDLGEWSVWLLAGMLVITLWQRFPYHVWRYVHKILAVIFLVLAAHAVVLAPPAWWQQPLGLLIGSAALLGSACALLSLAGRIGRRRQARAEVLSVTQRGDVLLLECRVPPDWRHEAGQFAFVRLPGWEGAHPFTIASAPGENRSLRFCIKALGDYTARLPALLQPGQMLTLEGPYGRFTPPASGRPQRWVAAGIGITPFLAWLESWQAHPASAPVADLHFCVSDAASAPELDRVQQLCTGLPSVNLHLHDSKAAGRADAPRLLARLPQDAQVWFCGPQGLGDALEAFLREQGLSQALHREVFRLR
ncbi:ferredoxin reductase family protein [Chitinilyticum piscinae]|uniref:Ferric reductase-like transmembrane domain-containing protein n=1 Tax=Chitinilyticum piscinae TaxID=2866724 RepID=A0A8J7FPC4_9NEIS|nr:ferric reductase-like transmembrane domain-containing protein [Chitinilyticum piscinae]MBE9609719.1 ferric reductase-like transmembrane domain-containing protein [Chitinilyticum piscinae]